MLFLSTPSARRATITGTAEKPAPYISIHALREEGDFRDWLTITKERGFLSTPSARRATGELLHSAGRHVISIHALREEGDANGNTIYDGVEVFLSTPSARRATACVADYRRTAKNFYPRPPRGGRPGLKVPTSYIYKFLSTPSARRATAKTETKSLFSYKLYNILHEFRRALIYNGSKNYPNHAK